jgi:dipeptidyl aminopeptidase/acylaminoacyl peptidase
MSMPASFAFCITAAFALSTQVSAQTRHDGDILSSKPWPALPDFDSLDDFSRHYFPKSLYDEARTQNTFDVLDIAYTSDGVPVRGILVQPKSRGARKWPAIIFNRGGAGDYGRITLTSGDTSSCRQDHTPCLTMVDLYLYAKAGFVVIASEYRFHGATAKQDQWGGVDVNDVLNPVPALRSLDFVDMERLYMVGVSRGGTMTYIALKRGIPVRAAAVIAGPSDLSDWKDMRPEFVNGDETYDGFAKVWPDYERRAEEQYHERSAVYWADRIKAPVLILHSRVDKLVPVSHSIRMAAALQGAGRSYALHIYSNDGHSLPANRADRNRQIIEWFGQAP